MCFVIQMVPGQAEGGRNAGAFRPSDNAARDQLGAKTAIEDPRDTLWATPRVDTGAAPFGDQNGPGDHHDEGRDDDATTWTTASIAASTARTTATSTTATTTASADKDCAGFATQALAQAFLVADPGPLLSLTIDQDGTLQVPPDARSAGWFELSPGPGPR